MTWEGCGFEGNKNPNDKPWCDVQPGCKAAREATKGYGGWDTCCSDPEGKDRRTCKKSIMKTGTTGYDVYQWDQDLEWKAEGRSWRLARPDAL